MPTQTFPCPFCGKRMGVGTELLGHKVRCPNPTCKQVIVAPLPQAEAAPVAAPSIEPAPPAPAPQPQMFAPQPQAVVPQPVYQPPQVEPQPVTSSPAPEPAPVDDLPTFNIAPREAHDSIFGEPEDHGDEIFGSAPKPPQIAIPEIPADFAAPPNGFAPSPAPAPYTPLQPVPSVAASPAFPTPAPSPSANPWAAFDAPAAPVAPMPAPAPALVPVPQMPLVPAVQPVLEEPLETLPYEDEAEASQLAAPSPQPAARPGARRTPPTKASGGSPGKLLKIGFFLLAPYALLMTGLAVYGLFLKSGAPSGHPLSTVPDNFGEYPPAERKKTSRIPGQLDGPLPPELTVALGNKLTIGQIEVEPIAVEERPLQFVIQSKNSSDKYRPKPTPPALVLHLNVKNISDDLLIYPLDPAFERKVTGNAHAGTGIVVGKQTFWGGAIEWPFSSRVGRKYEAAQEAEATPLKPGESREYVVCSDTDPKLIKAVQSAKDDLLWRVQIRRGRIEYHGKDVPVTAIIGVEFKASDVKQPT